MEIWNGMTRRELFTKYGPAACFLMAAIRSHRGLALNRRGRYIMLHTGAGYWMPKISPDGPVGVTEITDALLSGKSCQPLAAHKDNLIILRGVSIGPDGTKNLTDDPHDAGTVWLTTCAKNTPEGGNVTSTSGKYATAASFDEIVARRRGQTSLIHSQIAYNQNADRACSRHSYDASGQAISASQSPREIFRSVFGADGNRLFSNCGTDTKPTPPPVSTENASIQKSRLDTNLEEFSSLINSKRLANEEKELLKKMMANLRDLETNTVTPIGGGPTITGDQIVPFCNRMKDTKYAGNDGGKPPSASQVAEVASQIFDIVTLALVLDLTDSATLSFIPGGLSSFGYVGLPYTVNGNNLITDSSAEPHSLSHLPDDEDRRARIVAVDTFHAKQVAELANRLKSFSVGAGTLLDETVIQWGSEVGDGGPHTHGDTPLFLIGGKRLEAMPTGKLMVFDNRPSNARVY